MDGYIDFERSKFNYFVKENGHKKLADVEQELRNLVNELIRATWEGAGEEVRRHM